MGQVALNLRCAACKSTMPADFFTLVAVYQKPYFGHSREAIQRDFCNRCAERVGILLAETLKKECPDG